MVDASGCYPEGCRFESYPRSSKAPAGANSPASHGNPISSSTAPYVQGGARRASALLHPCSIKSTSHRRPRNQSRLDFMHVADESMPKNGRMSRWLVLRLCPGCAA